MMCELSCEIDVMTLKADRLGTKLQGVLQTTDTEDDDQRKRNRLPSTKEVVKESRNLENGMYDEAFISPCAAGSSGSSPSTKSSVLEEMPLESLNAFVSFEKVVLASNDSVIRLVSVEGF